MKPKPNDELRHEWRLSLKQRRGLAEATVSAKLKALSDFENFTSSRSFLKLDRNDVVEFKVHLAVTLSTKTGGRLSPSTIVHTLDHCRDFFEWLADTADGAKLDREAIRWFSPTGADREKARASAPKPIPTLPEAISAFEQMPSRTLKQRRDRALFATLLLTVCRADALASLTIGLVDLSIRAIRLDARVVRTKFSKSFIVFFLPFLAEARTALEDWLAELRALGLNDSDALFPHDKDLESLEAGEQRASPPYRCWSGSAQVRKIVRDAFIAAELPTYTVHVFRHMLTKHAMSLRLTPAELVSISLNLGHKRLETTLSSYGRPDDESRGRMIAGLGLSSSTDLNAILESLARSRPDLAVQVMLEFANYAK